MKCSDRLEGHQAPAVANTKGSLIGSDDMLYIELLNRLDKLQALVLFRVGPPGPTLPLFLGLGC